MNKNALISGGILLLFGAGCSQERTDDPDYGNDSAVDADERDILGDVPTVAEASASADREIDADNADSTLSDIRKELDDGE